MEELYRLGADNGAAVIIDKGSILDFCGDAIVNAANEGGTGGFGVDEAVNKAGGYALKEARKAFNGIATGDAKHTESFGHGKVRWIIHAVGPVYRVNQLQAAAGSVANTVEAFAAKDSQLQSAYRRSLELCAELGVETVAFGLLSAGVFRGERPLREILAAGLAAVLRHTTGSVKEVHLVAYTQEEQETLLTAAADAKREVR